MAKSLAKICSSVKLLADGRRERILSQHPVGLDRREEADDITDEPIYFGRDNESNK